MKALLTVTGTAVELSVVYGDGGKGHFGGVGGDDGGLGGWVDIVGVRDVGAMVVVRQDRALVGE